MKEFVEDVKADRRGSKGWPNTCYGMSKLGLIAYTNVSWLASIRRRGTLTTGWNCENITFIALPPRRVRKSSRAVRRMCRDCFCPFQEGKEGWQGCISGGRSCFVLHGHALQTICQHTVFDCERSRIATIMLFPPRRSSTTGITTMIGSCDFLERAADTNSFSGNETCCSERPVQRWPRVLFLHLRESIVASRVCYRAQKSMRARKNEKLLASEALASRI